MEYVEARIGISSSAINEIPKLREVFNDISIHACSLEIVGAANVHSQYGTSERNIILNVKVTTEGSSCTVSTQPPQSQSPPMQEVSTESPHMITSGLPQQDYQIAMYWWWPAGQDQVPATGSSSMTPMPETSNGPNEVHKNAILIERYKHTLYHCMHGKDIELCPFINNESEKKKCIKDYEEEFATGLKALLDNPEKPQAETNYDRYIFDHLENYCNCSLSCDMLWKYCINITKQYSVLQYAEEGLVVFSAFGENKVGKITGNYKHSLKNPIEHGGFGNVYRTSHKLVVKEEHTHPLIFSNPKLFQQVTKLKCKYVTPLLEYVVGKCKENNTDDSLSQRVFLSVMPYMNRGGLHKQFTGTCNCILKYMEAYKNQKERIFNNYIVIFSHVFEGLKYLHSKKIIHGDIKDKNVLVHQSCSCQAPLFCSCPSGGRVTYVLGDMSLFRKEEKQPSRKYMEWAKEKCNEPAGTTGMKAPELYFTDDQGESYISTKADIWAAGITMMKILTGLVKVYESKTQITKFFNAITLQVRNYMDDIQTACNLAEELQRKSANLIWNEETLEENDFIDKLNTVVQILESGEQLGQTHWMFSQTSPEVFPFSYLLGVLHVVSSLEQQCLDRLPDIHGTHLWKRMKYITGIIHSSIWFIPEERSSASDVTKRLEFLQQPKC